MAEPAENLPPEPVEPAPAAPRLTDESATPAAEPAHEPSVAVGTFLQFGKQGFRNVTVAGIDPATKRVLAFRRSGDNVERVLIPMKDYEDAVEVQKSYDKSKGVKQKLAMGRFVSGLLNRQVTHEGERGQVIGYDAQRNEALLTVDGKPKWVATPALLQSQKRLGIVREQAPTGAATPAPTAAKPTAAAPAIPTVRPVGVTVESAPAATTPSASAPPAVSEPVIQRLSPQESAELDSEVAEVETQSKTAAAAPPAAFVETVSRPVPAGSVSEQRRNLRIERQARSGGQTEVTAKVSGTIQAPSATPSEIETTVTGEIPAPSAVPAAIGVAVSTVAGGAAAAGTQAQVIAQATAALGALNLQIGTRQDQTEQLRGQMSQVANRINELNRQASALPPQNPERAQIEVRITTAQNERRGLQDQMTQLAVQNAQDRSTADSISVSLNNIQQAPPEQAPQELVAELQQKIQKNIVLPPAPTGEIPAAPSPAPIPGLRAPRPSSIPSAAPIQAPRPPALAASPLQAQESRIAAAPAPVRPRSRQGSVQQIRPPLQAIPGQGLETQRAVQFLGDQQADRMAEQRIPENEEMIDSYQQALTDEGAVGGELSPLELGTRQLQTQSYAFGAPEEEEPEDTFMLRENEGRRRMEEMNKTRPTAAPAAGAAGSAPTAAVPGAAPAAPGQGPAPAAGGASVVQRLLTAQNQAMQQRDKAQTGQAGLAQAQALDANLKAIQKLKRLYDVAKLGSAASVWGIILTILTMNLQLINKYTVKIRFIPAQSLVEDLVTIALDMLLMITVLTSIVCMLIIPALIAATIAGLFSIISDPGGWYDWARHAFTIVTGG